MNFPNIILKVIKNQTTGQCFRTTIAQSGCILVLAVVQEMLFHFYFYGLSGEHHHGALNFASDLQ